jgi:hypothetical protein
VTVGFEVTGERHFGNLLLAEARGLVVQPRARSPLPKSILHTRSQAAAFFRLSRGFCRRRSGGFTVVNFVGVLNIARSDSLSGCSGRLRDSLRCTDVWSYEPQRRSASLKLRWSPFVKRFHAFAEVGCAGQRRLTLRLKGLHRGKRA